MRNSKIIRFHFVQFLSYLEISRRNEKDKRFLQQFWCCLIDIDWRKKKERTICAGKEKNVSVEGGCNFYVKERDQRNQYITCLRNRQSTISYYGNSQDICFGNVQENEREDDWRGEESNEHRSFKVEVSSVNGIGVIIIILLRMYLSKI